MSKTPEDFIEPKNLRFLRLLVTVLTITMICGIITLVFLIVIKMKDLNANDLDAAVQIVAGTARSMGLVVEG